ncbi:hypothetical protein [Saccharothrix yanglingensis]|uniref:hypothetical protein n=1 Tax=Saccharothrix yanglingensis TaxID=659496 RepID=UPI0027D33D83|nr:hypothetical protein [Saccharothrix yanglingensis]
MIDPAGLSHAEPVVFAGDLFLRLAAEGRLVLDPAEADRVIEGLRHTLHVLTDRVHLVELLHDTPLDDIRRLHPEAEGAVVDAMFAEQVSGGALRRALDELPKYIRAFENAKRP